MKLELREISPELVDDFCKLHARPEMCGCFCRFWQFEGDSESWFNTTPDENRAVKEAEIKAGSARGALFYLAGRSVGWCQFAHRSFFKKMNSRDGFKHSANEDVWAISCFAIAKEVRKTGLSHRILEKVLERIKSLGGKTVEAYPEKGDNLPDDDVWMGPKRIFEAAGFTPHSETPKILVMRKEL
ncbi:MAG TPA: GNAT family N-acetyltransferase [candidate division Zixibacteria bacterium]|nr:GNAT family N-acetyltransferase [candidate division Zixibacteria bacterium]